MSAEIETPETMALRLWPSEREPSRMSTVGSQVALPTIRADREQIAAWCDGKAAEAKQEAASHDTQEAECLRGGDDHARAVSHRERVVRCEGQVSAFEALAAMLRGAR